MSYNHYHDVPRPKTPVEVLLIAESEPENGNYFYLPNPDRDTSFFHGIMQAFGFEEQHQKDNETELLATFLARGFFLIDACPKAVNMLTKKDRIEAIMKSKDSLLKVLTDLAPKKIVFLCLTNEKLSNSIVETTAHGPKVVKSKDKDRNAFPYPGNGWLSRKDGKGLIELLPDDLKAPKGAKK